MGNETMQIMLDKQTPTGRTTRATIGASGLGIVFVWLVPQVTDLTISTTEASILPTAIGSIAGFLWHQIFELRIWKVGK